jgi:hypothetical protein
MRRVDKVDQWLYSQTVPRAEKFWSFANRPFGEGVAFGMGRGMHHLGIAVREMTGASYIGAAYGHYRTAARGYFQASGAIPINAWDKYFTNIHPSLGPRPGFPRARGVAGALGRRGASAAGIMIRGLAPATLLYFAGQDEMGFGIGLAKEAAGWGAFAVGGSLGLQMGGWAAASTASAAGGAAEGGIAWALGKIPGIKKVGTTAIGRTIGRAAGAFLGGPIGFIVGGMAMMEMARWGVGMALHNLPTFAKEFRADMTTSGYGGDYVDSAGAITMRQRSLQAMGRSHTNARSALGQEASLLHV